MTPIKSISDIRGTIGGSPEDGLNPLAIVKFVAAHATFIRKNIKVETNKIIIGRDVRVSGSMVEQVVLGTLTSIELDVMDIDLATTPTIELTVTVEEACRGITLTASHNPKRWDALKLLNERSKFLNAAEGTEVLRITVAEDFEFADMDHLDKVIPDATYKQEHTKSALDLDLMNMGAIKAINFHVTIDCVNSVGSIMIPDLSYALGVKEVFKLHYAPYGNFSHNSEPTPENSTEISGLMGHTKADVDFVANPDTDHLTIICESGEVFNGEYTLVAVSDCVLNRTPGDIISDLSLGRAPRDATRVHDCEYNVVAVGGINMAIKMKVADIMIGGGGNGGVVCLVSHYGRDISVGIALFLTHLAKRKMRTSESKASYPPYFVSRQRVQLTPEIDVDTILAKAGEKFPQYDTTDIDGVKIDFPDRWVHLRESNTEPIIHIYSKAYMVEEAKELGGQLIQIINEVYK